MTVSREKLSEQRGEEMKKLVALIIGLIFIPLIIQDRSVIAIEDPLLLLQKANIALEEGLSFWSRNDTTTARLRFTEATEYYENIMNLNYIDKCVLQGLVFANYYLGYISSIDFIFQQSYLESESPVECTFVYTHVNDLLNSTQWKRFNGKLTDFEISWRGSLNKGGNNSIVLLWARADIYIQQGQQFSRNGAYFLSLKAYDRASKLLRRLNKSWSITLKEESTILIMSITDQILDAQVSGEIGRIYLLIDDKKMARSWLNDAQSAMGIAISSAEHFNSFLMSIAQGNKTYIDGLYYLVNGDYIASEEAFQLCKYYVFMGTFNTSFYSVTLFAFSPDNYAASAEIFLNIGLALSSQGRDNEASEYLQLALSQYDQGVPVAISRDSLDDQKLPGPVFAESEFINALNELGYALLHLGEIEQAQVAFKDALLRANLSNIPIEQYKALVGLGQVSERNGQVYEAIRLFKAAVEIYEDIFGNLQVDIFQISYQASGLESYRHLITLLVATGDTQNAFLYSERARTLVFKSQFINEFELSQPTSQTAGLVEEWKVMRQEIADLEAELGKVIPIDKDAREQISQIKSRIRDLTEDSNQLINSIILNTPFSTENSIYESPDLQSIQNLIPIDTTLIIYYLALNDQPLTFILTRDSLNAVFLETTYTEISSNVQTFRLDLMQNAPLQNLYSMLIEPIISEVDTQNLVIVPYGIINYVPFSALIDDQQIFLADKFVLSYSSSAFAYDLASAYSAAINTNNYSKVLIFGNPSSALPNLPYAEQEAVSVAEMFNTQAFIGPSASKDRFLRDASHADIIHLAAHGLINQLDPFATYIALSADQNGDNKLEVRDIYSLNLKTHHPLVVLSACNTAQAELTAGNEFQTLSRAFFIAGAREVVGSLWLVDDSSSTVSLMTLFYQNYMQGMSAAQALSEAQKEIRQTPGWESPKYWAGFVLNR